MKITVCRKEHFNAAHRLHNPDWSDEKNAEFYGKCNNEYYHGHNYELIVKVTTDINPESGYALDMKQLSDIIKTHITDKFDHKNLNLQTEEFMKTIPSAENMAVVFHQILTKELDKNCKIKIILYETERNFVEYPAE
jgi:6-pyruvoyltetrahydropterin/6-carboxytetrahydropterin synthase